LLPSNFHRLFLHQAGLVKQSTQTSALKVSRSRVICNVEIPSNNGRDFLHSGLIIGSDEYRNRFNQKFLERNDRFWSSMYEYFHMFGPKSLPFVTNFCIGSGKNFYRMGRSVKKSWFNLKMQGIQPSTPSREGFFTHFYDDAFDGGSSLSLDTTELIRIFVCELACDDDVIFSYTFKRKSEENDIQVNLNLLDTKTSVDVQLVFEGNNGTNPFAISCLAEDDVRNIAVYLANKRQTFVPSKINGWETRYYLLKFDKSIHARISDIGVKKIKRGNVLLGYMAFYSCNDLNRHEFSHINTVQM
jgi:mannosyl-glycoprotein endo-beta-N-acetylglucosaminidase